MRGPSAAEKSGTTIESLLQSHMQTIPAKRFGNATEFGAICALWPSRMLRVAGLQHPYCTGVLALTNDDEANLAVTMSAILLRPDVPHPAKSPEVARSPR